MLLVVDLGSSGVKTSVWRDCALVCSSSTHQIAKLNDPLAIFHCIDRAIDELLLETGLDLQISHVGFTSFGMSLLGISNNNDIVAFATYQGELYTFNQHTIEYDNNVTLSELEPGFEDRVGTPMPYHPCYAMLHMKRLETNALAVQRYSTLVSVWLERVIGNNKVNLPISYSEACWWGMFDWKEKKWAVKDHSLLPQVCDYNELEGFQLDKQYVKRWPQLRQAKFHLAVVDGAAVTLAAAPTNSCVVTVATSAAVRVLKSCDEVPTHVTRNGCFVHLLDSTRVVVGGSLTDGGSAWDLANTWVMPSQRRENGEHDMLALLLNKPLNLPICLPFFSGERAPGWRGTAVPGALIGITTKTTALEIKLAVVIGVGLRLREIYNAMQAVFNNNAVYVSGSGLINSLVWQTVVSAALGGARLFQATSGTEEARDNTTARGVALLIANQQCTSASSCVHQTAPEWLVQNLQAQLTLQNQYRRNLL